MRASSSSPDVRPLPKHEVAKRPTGVLWLVVIAHGNSAAVGSENATGIARARAVKLELVGDQEQKTRRTDIVLALEGCLVG